MATATATLAAAIERVGKVLALEERQGCQDRAVVGGIGPFARQHLAPLRGSLPTRAADDSLARIGTLLRDYHELAPDARRMRLGVALNELRQLYRQVSRLGENDPAAQPRYIGPRKAKELLFTGRRMGAQEAADIGMVNKVVPRAELTREAMAMASQIAKAEPFALKLTKRSINRTLDAQGLRTALHAHFDTHQLSHVTEAFKTARDRGLETAIQKAKGEAKR